MSDKLDGGIPWKSLFRGQVTSEIGLTLNRLMGTLKPQSNGPLYSNTGRWWVGCYIWYSEEGTGRAAA